MKKKLSYLGIMLLCAFLASPVYAADVRGCGFLGEDILIDEKIAKTVSSIILVIQVVVPVILVVIGMIDFMKAVIASKEDEIKKAQGLFIKRLIVSVLVFFVFAIVKMLISFVAEDSTRILNCANCFINGPKDSSCKNSATLENEIKDKEKEENQKESVSSNKES